MMREGNPAEMLHRSFRLISILLVVVFITALIHPALAQTGEGLQGIDPRQKAQTLLKSLSAEERVGQLFLITYKGTDIRENSQIYDLLITHHVGGVVLTADNNNFTAENTLNDVHGMISTLQTSRWVQDTGGAEPDDTGNAGNYIPLFFGISQEGDLAPNDQILEGVTSLPNLMAIGATWKPSLAQSVGSIMGRELQALGFNLYLGPSLDVLNIIRAERSEDLGTRTFGADPFWVGRMGSAYIKGLHQGSGGHLAVIAKHFPGAGGSDRPTEEEVATVRKSLDALKQIELAPFFAVTGNSADFESTADGLLVTHIRYQGFQGNIRATTRPVSLDGTSLDQLLSLPEISTWRENQGITVSDDLGSNAIRRFYDPTGVTFDARLIARNAFLAGNDLLYLNNFIAPGDPDSYTTILNTLNHFIQKYREDPAFAERVDESVLRILTLKYRLYSNFNLNQVLTSVERLSQIGTSESINFEVARQAVSLISPSAAELKLELPRPPGLRDRIVFLTDTIDQKQCSTCPVESILSETSFQQAVLRLYGPSAGGQVSSSLLSSYSFNALNLMLDDPLDQPELETDLQIATWIIVSIHQISENDPTSQAIKRLLEERPELLTNKKTIVFSFNAPYYFDTTDISKFTAYYGLYSKIPAFLDVATRVLFQELSADGALPVSVPGIAYDLITATSPDPNQVIPLYLDVPTTPSEGTSTPMPTPPTTFKIGDIIPLRTGVILDQNHHIVPDGTVVRFLFKLGGETGPIQQIEQVTAEGVASTTYRIQALGPIEISVVSEPALTSQVLQLNILEGEGGVPVFITPTSLPTLTPTPSPTPTLTPVVTETPPPSEPQAPGMGDWLLALILSWGGAVGIFFVGRRFSIRWGLRWSSLAALGGMLAFFLLILGLPGAFAWLEKAGTGGLAGIILAGIITGWLLGVGWFLLAGKAARSSPA